MCQFCIVYYVVFSLRHSYIICFAYFLLPDEYVYTLSVNTNSAYPVLLLSRIDGVAQWAAPLTRNMSVLGSSPIKGPRRFLEQETLPLLLSTGWFQKRIRACLHNRNKIM